MRVLKNSGSFKILSEPRDIIQKIADAARTCYQSQEFANENKNISLVRNLIKRGHFAMIEFADMTVQFNNICRGFTHEMVRHRLCSFAQESTRYVDESDFKTVVPPHKDENEKIIQLTLPNDREIKLSLKEWFALNEQCYRVLRDHGWKPEDARQVLPIATKSQIVVKANIREWRRIFHMRCDKFAHWEIRGVMLQLLNKCKKDIPLVFDDYKFYKQDSKSAVEYYPMLELQDIMEHGIFARSYGINL